MEDGEGDARGVGLLARGSVCAAAVRPRGREGWEAAGAPWADLPLSSEVSGVQGARELQVGMGRGAERGGRENGSHRVSPQDWVRPATCSAPRPPAPQAGLRGVETFQSGVASQISGDVTLDSGLPASLENPELRHPGLRPLHGRSWPACLPSTAPLRPCSDTRGQCRVASCLVCWAVFSSFLMSLLKVGKQKLHRGATCSPGGPRSSPSCLEVTGVGGALGKAS